MKTLAFLITIALAALLVANALKSPPTEAPESRLTELQQESDPVIASFERELDRQPVPAAPPTGEAIEEDVLYDTVNEVHWTRDGENDTDTADE